MLLNNVAETTELYVDFLDSVVISTLQAMIDPDFVLDATYYREHLRKRVHIAHANLDLLECQTMELGYRIATVLASLVSPILDLETKYHNNYIFSDSDDRKHKQPRHLEASISTLLVGANFPYFYGAHLAADLNRALLSIADVMLANADDPTKYATELLTIAAQYKYTPQLLTLRRDFLIAVLRFFQVLTDFTIDVTNASTEVKDQKEVALVAFQETVVALTGSAQSLVAILGEAFMEAVESAVELFMMFVSALYSFIDPKADSSRNKLNEFFVELFIQIGKVTIDLAKGLFDMLFKGPFGDLWRGLCAGVKLI
jgi:hypothetical protein